ncbi:hypothetical protein ACFL2K_01395 [Candidatus Margulisiibacteriota bacterium]
MSSIKYKRNYPLAILGKPGILKNNRNCTKEKKAATERNRKKINFNNGINEVVKYLDYWDINNLRLASFDFNNAILNKQKHKYMLIESILHSKLVQTEFDGSRKSKQVVMKEFITKFGEKFLSKLKELDFNAYNYPDTKSLNKCTSLEKLSLDGFNNDKQFNEALLGKNKLKELEIYGCKLKKPEIKLPRLKQLELDCDLSPQIMKQILIDNPMIKNLEIYGISKLKNINKVFPNIEVCKIISNSINKIDALNILRIFPNLKVFELSPIKKFENLSELTMKSNKLKEFKLGAGYSDGSLKKVSVNCPNLEKIDMFGYRGELEFKGKKLSKIRLRDCDEKILDNFVTACKDTVKNIELLGFKINTLTTFIKSLMNLESLDLRSLKAMYKLELSSDSLKRIKISMCGDLKKIKIECPKLEEIIIWRLKNNKNKSLPITLVETSDNFKLTKNYYN